MVAFRERARPVGAAPGQDDRHKRSYQLLSHVITGASSGGEPGNSSLGSWEGVPQAGQSHLAGFCSGFCLESESGSHTAVSRLFVTPWPTQSMEFSR